MKADQWLLQVLLLALSWSISSSDLVIPKGHDIVFANNVSLGAEFLSALLYRRNWMDEDPILYYDFENYSNGTTILLYPVTGHGLREHALLPSPDYNITFVPGPRGQALRFDGNLRLCMPSPPVLALGRNWITKMSISFWFRPRCTRCTLFDFNYKFNGIEHGFMAFLGLIGEDLSPWSAHEENGKLMFAFGAFTYNFNGDSLMPGPKPTQDEWAHHVIVMDKGDVKFYVNGVQTHSATHPSDGIKVLYHSVCFGGPQTSGHIHYRQAYLDGDLDEFRVFMRALNDTEVASEYDR